jgi:hypothetical protein
MLSALLAPGWDLLEKGFEYEELTSAVGIVQAAECMPSKCEALSSNPSTTPPQKNLKQITDV